MYRHFVKYFFFYIYRAKTRQRLLFLAIVGLILSAFSLLVLQSTMGGLQYKLIERSQHVQGHATLFLKNMDFSQAQKLNRELRAAGHQSFLEYEIELLLKKGHYLTAALAHGLDETYGLPAFLQVDELDGLVLPNELAFKIKASYGDHVTLMSPAHVDSLLGDIPRMSSVTVSEIVSTDVPEVDTFHLWLRLPKLQNMVKRRLANRIRLYNAVNAVALKDWLAQKVPHQVHMETWQEQNKTLLWALSLESTVMIFLFIAMTMLVSLCITSGLLIFFDKILTDMSSFWILGASHKQLQRAAAIFLNIMGLVSVLFGLGLGLIFLFLLDNYALNIMPDIFVDRQIPIHISSRGLLVSFFVPYGISMVFSFFSLNQFKKDTNYLDHVKSFS